MNGSNILPLSDAIDDIVNARLLHGQRQFFYMVGAGLSYPPIPLASGIIAECKKELLERKGLEKLTEIGNHLKRQNASPILEYETYFQKAFSQPVQRQALLRRMMETTTVSHANLRLAHLLSAPLDKTISEIVLTTNFDELLFKCVRLFGRQPLVIDHPGITERLDLRSGDIQIVHLHGRFWNYDCVNLRFEQIQRSQHSGITTLLGRVFSERSPIVIGYSGWEEDAFMTHLKQRLVGSESLRSNVYWFCYSPDAYENFPSWLKDSNKVYFVVPKSRTRFSEAEREQPPGFEPLCDAPGFEFDASDSSTLPATQVFDEMIKKLDMEPPRLTRRPLEYYSEQLAQLLPPHTRFAARTYFIRRLSRIVKLGASFQGHRFDSNKMLESVDYIIEDVQRARYEDALRKSEEFWQTYPQNSEPSEIYELNDFQDAVWTAVLGIDSSKSKLDFTGHRIVWECCEYILRYPNLISTEDVENLTHRIATSKLFAGIKQMLRSATPHTDTEPFVKAKDRFLQAKESLGLLKDQKPFATLLLWAHVNIAYAEYFLNNHQQGLDELSPVLEDFRPRMEGEPELVYPFYMGLLNKAVLEFMCRKPYQGTLKEIADLETPPNAVMCDLVKKAREILSDSHRS